MSFRSRTNSFVEHVRGFIHLPAHHVKQNPIELGSLETLDGLGSSLHKEAVSGSRRALKKVLLSAVCVDYPNNRGQTPLFCACARGNEVNALLLLEYGANPNEKSQEGVTPVHAACYVGNIRLLGKLIECGGDLRLHDNEGYGVRHWTLQNSDPKQKTKMLEFLNKTHVYAMAYVGDAANADNFTKSAGRIHKQTSFMELMKMRTGSDSTFDNLRRVQSMGFGKVYLGGDFSGGIVSIVPLVCEALLTSTDRVCFETGSGTYIEQMKWSHMEVSVKKVRRTVETKQEIDNIITEAEFLGKLRHPNVVLLMGICQSALLDDMWLILEHSQQATLHHSLHHSKARLDLMRKQCIICQVCNAMEFIHSQNLIHCGLSSMAIYMVTPHSAKLGNFEFMVESVKADLGKTSRVASVSHGLQLYNWMAPELMREEAPHFSSDIYSLCCIVWELFSGELPWAGLEAEDIYQQVVKEKVPLDLTCAALPNKFKSIIGYGLELEESKRLHRVSLLTQWLTAEEIPKFCRSHNSLHLVNKSSNHVESISSSSSPSSSLLSISSKTESPLCDSHIKCNKAQPPLKPPRSFAYVSCVPVDPPALVENTKVYQNLDGRFASTPVALHGKKTASQPVSPTRIKPASHSYHYGVVGETCCAAIPRKTVKQQDQRETETVRETRTVKEMTEKYQHIHNQHKLRQAILKGSMAPRGSCHNICSSLESIKSESWDTLADLDPVLSSPSGLQAVALGSLDSTPHVRCSSTPKGFSVTCGPDNIPTPCGNQSQPLVDSSTSVKEKTSSSNSQEPDIERRRAFINDIWQKYLNLEESSLTPKFCYRSPLLKLHSPYESRSPLLKVNSPYESKCTVASGTENMRLLSSEMETTSGTATQVAHTPASDTAQLQMTSLCGQVSPRCTNFEEDSLWTVTSLGLKEGSENDVCNILHADYPSPTQGLRVLVKADGMNMCTAYYQQLQPPREHKSLDFGHKETTSTSHDTLPQHLHVCAGKDISTVHDRDNETFTVNSETTTNVCDGKVGPAAPAKPQIWDTPTTGHEWQLRQQSDTLTQQNMQPLTDDFEFLEYYIDDDPVAELHTDTCTQLGQAGPAGQLGQAGPAGQLGQAGPAGQLGQAGPAGQLGPAGPAGQLGQAGPAGQLGQAGPAGQLGQAGPAGQLGQAGPAGQLGQAGPAGQLGQAGPAGQLGQAVEKSLVSVKNLSSSKDQLKAQSHKPTRVISRPKQKPSMSLQKSLPVTINTCQSALLKNSEQEDARQNMLWKQSASEKDLFLSKGIHLIARHYSGSTRGRNREQSKASVTCDMLHGLRSGNSEPSLSLSLVRDSNPPETVQGTTLADTQETKLPHVQETRPFDRQKTRQADVEETLQADDETTVESLSQSLDDAETCLTHVETKQKEKILSSQTKLKTAETRKYEVPHSDSETRKYEVPHSDSETRKYEVPRSDSETRECEIPHSDSETRKYEIPHSDSETRKYEVPRSDSGDSDQWVKTRLSAIQSKIQRRKNRPEYTISSDEDEDNWFLNLSTPTQDASDQATSSTRQSEYPVRNAVKPNSYRYRSLCDMGIQLNENYSKVMEQLKITCRHRQSQMCSKPIPKLRKVNRNQPSFDVDGNHLPGNPLKLVYSNSGSFQAEGVMKTVNNGAELVGSRQSDSSIQTSTKSGSKKVTGTGTEENSHKIRAPEGCPHDILAGSASQGLRQNSSRGKNPTQCLDRPSVSKHSCVSSSQHTKRSPSRSGRPYDTDTHRKTSQLPAGGKKLTRSATGELEPSSTRQEVEDHQLTVALQHAHSSPTGNRRQKANLQDILGYHRFFIPRASWQDGCQAKLNVEVDQDSHRVTTTATNLTTGHTETLLDQVVLTSKLKSTIRLD